MTTSERNVRPPLTVVSTADGTHANNFKTINTVGPGAYEVRVWDFDGIARLMYVAKFHDTICVLHVFTKKSMRTPKTDIDLAKRRYREARDG